MYITIQNYLQVKSFLTDDLQLDSDNIVLTNIIKPGYGVVEHKVRVNAYLYVTDQWVKLAREQIKKNSLFALLRDEKVTLRTTKNLKAEIIQI